ncbi:glycerophosphodiester phosphodiesterase family protein [Allorhodopirellula heiligendammensis]|uniref:Glycerophosphoryl diester phosphodiesterase 1 n=1 Tax=Allorhodopirellula heiligendammensis TaxID=2714739 RepID=A0A5C6C6X2_9BACT|nr:glycerophosphodiester phosphodiesterase family protein [Allorhodopirellula heiligendammensis]TWU18529.1 putative glycerophosphoryl diester phosphodiesterase 1 [Allorhodopirellula heiligendammensis]
MTKSISVSRLAVPIVTLITAAAISSVCSAQTAANPRWIAPLTATELQAQLRYDGPPLVIISAHRGGPGRGLPENAIETFEHSLRNEPSMMEVDPRLTKDGQIVLLHDATLDRTTTGTGLVRDATLEELKNLYLKDIDGTVTEYRIPTLDEAITWARGRTILVLDQKDVPLDLRVQKIIEHNAQGFVMLIVNNIAEAKRCHQLDKNICMEVMLGDRKKLQAFETSGVPWGNILAFIGHQPSHDQELIQRIHDEGARCMSGTSRNLDQQIVIDRARQPADLEASYRELLQMGIDVIETDRPIEVGTILAKAAPTSWRESTLETVQVDPDAGGFILHPSRKRYVPWGHNYASVDLMERLANDPARVQREFTEMRAAGTTVARVHPEMPRLMKGPQEADPEGLALLRRLLGIAQGAGIHLMITGLACYQIDDRMAWYDSLEEAQRWETQAFFWQTIARTCADSPAVFAYDLVNEPGAIGTPEEGWYLGRMGYVEFCQRLSLDAQERNGDEIFRQWTRKMVAAIRSQDQTHLITLGMLPFPGVYKVAAEELDFVSPHLYPKTDKVDAEIELLKKYDWGKPIVIGETFPLSCSVDDERDFLLKSHGIADGWIGHWPDESPTELTRLQESGTATIHNAIWLSWVNLFRELGPQMVGEETP